MAKTSMKVMLSATKQSARIELSAPQLTAADLEELIGHLANIRRQMSPPIGLDSSPLDRANPPTPGTISPRVDLALLEQSPTPVMLAVALDGLGWHTILLAPDEAESLGRRLLALSPTILN